MPKKLTSDHFIPAQAALENLASLHILTAELQNNPADRTHVDDQILITKKVKRIVNPDVCLNSDQVDVVQLIINSLARDNYGSIYINAVQVAQFVNSVRNECATCLNADCPMRSDKV